MALNWKTYNSIPRLHTYREALDHYHNVAPILRDAHNTRPCGRRDQKYFSIWVVGSGPTPVVHVGYGSHELSERTTLVSYHPGGTITLHKRTRWSSASDHERMTKLLGTPFRTYQYSTWVQCGWYDNGELRKGWMPLRKTAARNWNSPPEEHALSNFVRDPSGQLVFQNYTYPTTHKLNKTKYKEAIAPYQHFTAYVESMSRLQGLPADSSGAHYYRRMEFSKETYIEVFGEDGDVNRTVPSLWWGNDELVRANRQTFLQQAASTDLMDQLRALLTLDHSLGYAGGTHKKAFERLLISTQRGVVFDTVTHTEGKLVKDKYASVFRD